MVLGILWGGFIGKIEPGDMGPFYPEMFINNFLLTKFNFKSEEFIATLLCFSSRLIADVAKLVAPVKSNTIDELRAITLMQRGYLLMNNTDSYQKKLNDDNTKRLTMKMVSRFFSLGIIFKKRLE